MSTKKTPEASSTASLATKAQVDRIKGLVAKRLRALTHEEAQAIITNGDVYQGTFDKMMGEVIESVMGTIVRHVHVNRGRTLQQVIDATGLRQNVKRSVLNTVPMGEGEVVEVEFFPLSRYSTENEVAAELKWRGLEIDPVAQATLNEAEPAFADTYPNGTYWRLRNGDFGYMIFDRNDGERYVAVYEGNGSWGNSLLFGGVRKKKAIES